MRFIAQNRLEDGNLNSRGLLSPWKYDKKMKWRLKDAERLTIFNDEYKSTLPIRVFADAIIMCL